MPNTNQKPARLTTRQVADQLGKSVSQITRYAADLDVEKLPGKTGHYLFTADDVAKIRALIAQHRVLGLRGADDPDDKRDEEADS